MSCNTQILIQDSWVIYNILLMWWGILWLREFIIHCTCKDQTLQWVTWLCLSVQMCPLWGCGWNATASEGTNARVSTRLWCSTLPLLPTADQGSVVNSRLCQHDLYSLLLNRLSARPISTADQGSVVNSRLYQQYLYFLLLNGLSARPTPHCWPR